MAITRKIDKQTSSSRNFMQAIRVYVFTPHQFPLQTLNFSAPWLLCSLSRVRTRIFVSAAAGGDRLITGQEGSPTAVLSPAVRTSGIFLVVDLLRCGRRVLTPPGIVTVTFAN